MRRWVVPSVFLIGVLLATSEFVAANTGNVVVRLNGRAANNITADTFMIGGAKDISGPSFPSHGTSTLCYSLQFTISPSAAPEFYGFCVDNIFMTPSDTWAFVAVDGTGSWAPNFQGNHNTSSSNPDAPAVCFDIALPAYMCGDANGDLTVNIGDAVHVIN